ncbi:MAG: sugar-binding protein [Candidatus Firestonebacteria bacterium]
MIYLEKEKRFMLKGDLHIHSNNSDGDLLEKDLIVAVNAGLDFISMSDHDTPNGSKDAQKIINKLDLPFLIVPGNEVTASGGFHLLVFGLMQDIMNLDDTSELCRKIRAYGGYICASHPCWKRTRERFWDTGLFHKMVESGEIDGIELINYTANKDEEGDESIANIPVIEYYQKLMSQGIVFPITVGSDAHRSENIGKVFMTVFSKEFTVPSILEAIFVEKLAVAHWKNMIYGPESALSLYETYKDLAQQQLSERKMVEISHKKHIRSDGVYFDVMLKQDMTKPDLSSSKLLCANSQLQLLEVNEKSQNKTFYLCKDNFIPSLNPVFAKIDNEKQSFIVADLLEIEPIIDVKLHPVLQKGQVILSLFVKNISQYKIENLTLDWDVHQLKGKYLLDKINIGETKQIFLDTALLHSNGKDNFINITGAFSGRLCLNITQILPVLLASLNASNDDVAFTHYCLKDKLRDDDVHSVFNTFWDNEYLTITIQVQDKYFYQPFHGASDYLGDSIQIGIDPYCSRSVNNWNNRQIWDFIIALTNSGPEIVETIIPKDNTIKNPAKYTNLSIEKNSDNTYKYIFKVPWKILGLKPDYGTTIGLWVMVNVNDGYGYRGYIRWAKNGDYNNPSDWGWLILK